MECCLFPSLPSFSCLSVSLQLQSLCIPYLSWDSLKIQLRGSGECCEFSSWCRQSPVNKQGSWCILSWKSQSPWLCKFSDNQVCVVTLVGSATCHYGTSQQRNVSMVLSWPRKCQHGILSHSQPRYDLICLTFVISADKCVKWCYCTACFQCIYCVDDYAAACEFFRWFGVAYVS